MASCQACARPGGNLQVPHDAPSNGETTLGWRRPDGVDDADWDEFTLFFEKYSQGKLGSVGIPPPPKLLAAALEDGCEGVPHDPLDLSLPTPSAPVEFLEFFIRHKFLPAPAVPNDAVRHSLLRNYNIDRVGRNRALDRVTNLARAYFKVPISALSIQLPFKQVILAETGWVPKKADGSPGDLPSLSAPCSFCSHGYLLPVQAGGLVIYDSKKDWRFRCGNPHTVGDSPSISFYVSEHVLLPIPGSSPDEPMNLVPAGNLCVVSPSTRAEGTVSEADRRVLRDLALLAGRELYLSAEMVRKQKQEEQVEFIGALIKRSAISTGADSNSTPSASTMSGQSESEPANMFEESVKRIQQSLGIDFCALLDVRLSQRPNEASEKLSSASWGLPIKVLASTLPKLEDLVASPAYLKAVHETTSALYTEEDFLLAPTEMAANLLPPQYKVFKVIAVRQPGSPLDMVLLLLGSEDRFFAFDNSQDLAFSRHVASICLLFLAQMRIVEADRAKLRFVSHIAHETRTPLHSIASHFDLVKEEMSPDDVDRLGAVLNVTEASIAALKNILDDALDLSKLTNVLEGASEGTGALWNLEDRDLGALVTSAAQETHSQFVKTERATSDEGSEPFEVPVVVTVAARATGWRGVLPVSILRRCLSNLVGNSCKYTKRGRITVALREGGAKASDGSPVDVVIEVADTGIGMDDEFIRSGKAVMPFIQADPFSPGAGLGLSMVDQLCRSLKGRMNIESKLGAGTTVTLVLSLQLIDGPAAARSSEQFDVAARMPIHPIGPREFKGVTVPPTAVPMNSASKKSCLVVEDNTISMRVLMMLLKKKGVDCHPAVDGREAVDVYTTLRPRLVLMDLQMPIMSGWAATRRIRSYEKEHGLPAACIMALTSQSHHDKEEADNAGFNGWIVKGGSANSEVTALLVQQGFVS